MQAKAGRANATFGQEGGQEVNNKHAVLSRVDAALGMRSPPALEYIFCEPSPPAQCDSFLKRFLAYSFGHGHAALRYTLPPLEGAGQDAAPRQFLLNITNPAANGGKIVCSLEPAEYFFGTSAAVFGASEQYGIYCRSYVTLRFEELAAHQVLALHEYFQALQKRSARGEVVFAPTPFHSWWLQLRYSFDKRQPEPGNCAEWISKGLAKAGVLDRRRMLAKQIFVDLLEKFAALRAMAVAAQARVAGSDGDDLAGMAGASGGGGGAGADTGSCAGADAAAAASAAAAAAAGGCGGGSGSLHIVSLRRAKHAALHPDYAGYAVDDPADPAARCVMGHVGLLEWVCAWVFWDLEQFADVVVDVPEGGVEARLRRQRARLGVWSEGTWCEGNSLALRRSTWLAFFVHHRVEARLVPLALAVVLWNHTGVAALLLLGFVAAARLTGHFVAFDLCVIQATLFGFFGLFKAARWLWWLVAPGGPGLIAQLAPGCCLYVVWRSVFYKFM